MNVNNVIQSFQQIKVAGSLGGEARHFDINPAAADSFIKDEFAENIGALVMVDQGWLPVPADKDPESGKVWIQEGSMDVRSSFQSEGNGENGYMESQGSIDGKAYCLFQEAYPNGPARWLQMSGDSAGNLTHAALLTRDRFQKSQLEILDIDGQLANDPTYGKLNTHILGSLPSRQKSAPLDADELLRRAEQNFQAGITSRDLNVPDGLLGR